MTPYHTLIYELFMLNTTKMPKELDPHSLFSIFEHGDEEIYKEHNVTAVLDNPYVVIGMVTRSVQNYYIMEAMYRRTHKEQYDRARPRIKYKYYSKLFAYLKRLEISSFKTIYCIGDGYDLNSTLFAMDDLLKYFESIEFYERCAFIKPFIDVLESKNLKRELKHLISQ